MRLTEMTTSEAGVQGREFTITPKFPWLMDPHWPFVESVIVVDNCSFIVIAHQLGHHLGMSHVKEFGLFRKKHCIVSAHNTNTSAFSNCSYGSYFNLINHSNKVLEGDEESNCRSERQCRKDP
ncbi:hypothetical protein GH733_002280 [Mirounga leonina]|nr:hypothetical protein GH733_002280 [Mirounga leonina]